MWLRLHPSRKIRKRTTIKRARDDVAIGGFQLSTGRLRGPASWAKRGIPADSSAWQQQQLAATRAITTQGLFSYGRTAGDGNAPSRPDSGGHATVPASWRFAARRLGPDL